jgi:hypothetical protein
MPTHASSLHPCFPSTARVAVPAGRGRIVGPYRHVWYRRGDSWEDDELFWAMLWALWTQEKYEKADRLVKAMNGEESDG